MVALAGFGDGVLADIDCGDVFGLAGEFRRAVAGSTAEIDYAFEAAEASGEEVAGEVFVPEIDIDFAGYDPFTGKLSHV